MKIRECLKDKEGKPVIKKLQLVYLRDSWMSCIPHPHFDLCSDEKNPYNVACILVNGKECIGIIKKMLKLYNETLVEKRIIFNSYEDYIKNGKHIKVGQKYYIRNKK